MDVHVRPESVFTLNRNGCSQWAGIRSAGTYNATVGSNTPPSSSFEGALWNFNYYVSLTLGNFSLLQFDLVYDFNPASGNDESTHGTLNLNVQAGIEAAIAGGFTDPAEIAGELDDIIPGLTETQGSQNLLFSFLGSPVLGYVAPPVPAGSFDPNVPGEYTFALVASNNDVSEVARSAIRVLVDDVDDNREVPVPATLPLVGIGLLLLRKRANA